jgi:hypothetical protein
MKIEYHSNTVGFTSIYAVSDYHHSSCEFDCRQGLLETKFVKDVPQVFFVISFFNLYLPVL